MAYFLWFKSVIREGNEIIQIIKTETIISPPTRALLLSRGWKIYRENGSFCIGKATGLYDEEIIFMLENNKISALHYGAKATDPIELE